MAAALYYNTQQLELALDLFKAAMVLRERVRTRRRALRGVLTRRQILGAHPDTAALQNNTAACLECLDRTAAAVPLYRAALDVRPPLAQPGRR
jgi:hypothetical protein